MMHNTKNTMTALVRMQPSVPLEIAWSIAEAKAQFERVVKNMPDTRSYKVWIREQKDKPKPSFIERIKKWFKKKEKPAKRPMQIGQFSWEEILNHHPDLFTGRLYRNYTGSIDLEQYHTVKTLADIYAIFRVRPSVILEEVIRRKNLKNALDIMSSFLSNQFGALETIFSAQETHVTLDNYKTINMKPNYMNTIPALKRILSSYLATIKMEEIRRFISGFVPVEQLHIEKVLWPEFFNEEYKNNKTDASEENNEKEEKVNLVQLIEKYNDIIDRGASIMLALIMLYVAGKITPYYFHINLDYRKVYLGFQLAKTWIRVQSVFWAALISTIYGVYAMYGSAGLAYQRLCERLGIGEEYIENGLALMQAIADDLGENEKQSNS